jgi:hypothetical protein
MRYFLPLLLLLFLLLPLLPACSGGHSPRLADGGPIASDDAQVLPGDATPPAPDAQHADAGTTTPDAYVAPDAPPVSACSGSSLPAGPTDWHVLSAGACELSLDIDFQCGDTHLHELTSGVWDIDHTPSDVMFGNRRDGCDTSCAVSYDASAGHLELACSVTDVLGTTPCSYVLVR